MIILRGFRCVGMSRLAPPLIPHHSVRVLVYRRVCVCVCVCVFVCVCVCGIRSQRVACLWWALDFPSAASGAKFDAVVSSEVLEHVSDVPGFIQACADLVQARRVAVALCCCQPDACVCGPAARRGCRIHNAEPHGGFPRVGDHPRRARVWPVAERYTRVGEIHHAQGVGAARTRSWFAPDGCDGVPV